MRRTGLKALGVRIGANILYHSGALTLIRETSKRRYALRDTLDYQVAPFIVLLYHRVNPENDPLFPAMAVSTFEQQVRYLAANFHVLPLGEIVHRINSDLPLEPLTAAITFDDGYLDNYTFAHPILKRYCVPATLFVATGYIGTGEVMWNDQVAWSIKNTHRKTMRWCFMGEEVLLRFETLEEKARSLTIVLEKLKVLPETEKKSALRELIESFGASHSDLRRLMLGWEEVRRMVEDGWEIGSHSVTHSILTRVRSEEAKTELQRSKQMIEQCVGTPVTLCAFPNGKRPDFDSRIKGITKELGYRAAVTTLRGIN